MVDAEVLQLVMLFWQARGIITDPGGYLWLSRFCISSFPCKIFLKRPLEQGVREMDNDNAKLPGYCSYWNGSSPAERRYHDEEWGVPVHDDRRLFEALSLEVFQCGLSWATVAKRRPALNQAFQDFDVARVAAFTDEDAARIMNLPGMIRSLPKIRAVIANARCFLEIRREYGSFAAYLWNRAGGRPIVYPGHSRGFIPASNGLSRDFARDLRSRGFRYLGAVTVYAFLQATGVINDHDARCPCFQRIAVAFPPREGPGDREENLRDYGGAS